MGNAVRLGKGTALPAMLPMPTAVTYKLDGHSVSGSELFDLIANGRAARPSST